MGSVEANLGPPTASSPIAVVPAGMQPKPQPQPAKQRDVGLRLRGCTRMEVRGRRPAPVLDSASAAAQAAGTINNSDGAVGPAQKRRRQSEDGCVTVGAAEAAARWAQTAPQAVEAQLGHAPGGLCQKLAEKPSEELRSLLREFAGRRDAVASGWDTAVSDWVEGMVVALLALDLGVQVGVWRSPQDALANDLSVWAAAGPPGLEGAFTGGPAVVCARLQALSEKSMSETASGLARRRHLEDRDRAVTEWLSRCVRGLLRHHFPRWAGPQGSTLVPVPRPCLTPETDVHQLRISAGRAASAAGLHPYTDVGEMFLEFVYQDLPELLLRDAAVAGVEVLSAQDERERLLAKCGAREAFAEALRRGAASQGVEALKSARADVARIASEVQAAGRVTAEEAAEIQRALELEINLDFGERHEDSAVAAYSKRIGLPVYGDQHRVKVAMPWPSGCGNAPTAADLAMTGVLPAHRIGSRREELDRGFGGGGMFGDPREAFFYLTGFTDGIVDIPVAQTTPQPTLSGGAPPCAADAAPVETVVVEVKHRMGRIPEPPNLYDVVQLGCYCRVLGCSRGHLVQCLREGAAVGRDGCVGELRVSELDFREGSVDRKGWDESVLPGMYAIVQAVYAARADEALRLRLLRASTEERGGIVRGLCPHL